MRHETKDNAKFAHIPGRGPTLAAMRVGVEVMAANSAANIKSYSARPRKLIARFFPQFQFESNVYLGE